MIDTDIARYLAELARDESAGFRLPRRGRRARLDDLLCGLLYGRTPRTWTPARLDAMRRAVAFRLAREVLSGDGVSTGTEYLARRLLLGPAPGIRRPTGEPVEPWLFDDLDAADMIATARFLNDQEGKA